MIKKILMLGILGLFVFNGSEISFAMSCHGEGQDQMAAGTTEHEHGKLEPAKQEAKTEAVNVGNKICPVSGEKIGQGGMEAVTYEYKGKIYNFCCPMCVDEFKKNPEKYIEKVEEELQVK